MEEKLKTLDRLALDLSCERLCSIEMNETLGLNRFGEPVNIGIPFPRGRVFDASRLVIFNDAEEPLPTQVQVLGRWPDGSLKWGLLDFYVDIKAECNANYILGLTSSVGSECSLDRVAIQEHCDEFIIDTGLAKFILNKREFQPFAQVEIQGRKVLSDPGSRIVLTNKDDEEFLPVIDDIKLGCSGPVRFTFLIRGSFVNQSREAIGFFSQLSFFAGSGFVEFTFTINNPRAASHPGGLWDLGDCGSFYFRDLSVQMPFPMEMTYWNAQPHKPREPHHGSGLEIYQDSSGGQHWNSQNHCNRYGKVVPSFCGYEVRENQEIVSKGKRALPTVLLEGSEVNFESSMEKFWQNFPKAIEVQQNGLMLRLFPKQCQDLFELQGGEQKTHTVFFQFSLASQKTVPLNWVHERILPRLPAEWYAQSEAIPYLTSRALDDQEEYLDLIDSAIMGENTFFDRREIIDEYGWRNFGDIYADHEAVGHKGPTPKISHYNNQYDIINGALIEFFRSGDSRWHVLMNDLARHVIDIDLYHTTEDRPEYNGGMFWHTDHYFDAGTASHRAYSKANADPSDPSMYGGGPSNEQNYTTGLLHYYYLSGDPLASEAVLSLANWVLQMDKGSRHWLRYLDPRPTGLASSSAGRDYHGPGRGAGNSINALLDAYALVFNREYVEKAEALIRRCIHPHDNIEERNFGDVEYRWSYTVFLQILGKYLDFKVEHREIDTMYAYAQASLIHYAQWMVAHEVPYQQVIHKVKIPTETWPAQDIRKSNVFKFAAKYSEGLLRDTFLRKSEEFFQASIRDLRSYATSHLTRPIVLLLVNGYMHASFAANPDQRGVLLKEYPDFGNPQPFSPQLSEVYKLKEWMDECRGKIQSWTSGRKP